MLDAAMRRLAATCSLAFLFLLSSSGPASTRALAEWRDEAGAFGARCDGSVDDTMAIQSAIDALSTNGGTVVLPTDGGHPCMIGGSGLTMKDNVRIYGLGSGTLKAHSSLTDEIIHGVAGTDGWEIRGVRFDMNGKAAGAVDVSGRDWRFTDNVVSGGATGPQAAHSLVKLTCTARTRSECRIQDNAIVGSNDATTNDTCLEVTGGDPASYSGFGFQVTGNDITRCGRHGIWLSGRTGGYILAGNNIDGVKDVPIYTDTFVLSAGATIQNNVLDGDGEACIVQRHGNIEVSGNHCSATSTGLAYVHRASSVDSPRNNAAGIRLQDNYFARGIWLDSRSHCSTTTSAECDVDEDCPAGESCDASDFIRYDHVSVTGNAVASPNTCIRAENITDSVINDNTLLGGKQNRDHGGIEIFNSMSDFAVGHVTIAGNSIGVYQRTGGGGRAWCIKWNDAGGGGFESFTVDANDCGRAVWPPGNEVPLYAMIATGSPSTWNDMVFTGNTFGAPATFFRNEPPGSYYCNNVGVDDTCGRAAAVDADVLDSDQTIDGTTLTNVTNLSASLSANEYYTVNGFVSIAGGSDADAKLSIACAGTAPADSRFFTSQWHGAGAPDECDAATFAVGGDAVCTWAAGPRTWNVEISGYVRAGAGPCTLMLQAAENTSGTDVVVREGTNWMVVKTDLAHRRPK